MNAALRRISGEHKLYAALFIGLMLLAGIKLYHLLQWQYTRDGFRYAVMLGETLRGHWWFEHTYGYHFGDHLYLWAAPLLLLRAVLHKHTIVALCVLQPCALFAYAMFWRFVTFAKRDTATQALGLAGLLPFVLLPAAGIEKIWGFHFDNLAVPLGLALGASLVRRDALETRGRGWLVDALWLCFMAVQESFIGVSSVIFAVTAVGTRRKADIARAAVSLALFALAMRVLHAGGTEFNITDEAVLRHFWAKLSHSPIALLRSAKADYVAMVLCVAAAFAYARLCARRTDWAALGLWAGGMTRLSMAFITQDFAPVTWHNLPGLALCFGGAGFQMLQAQLWPSQARVRWACACGLVVAFGINVKWRRVYEHTPLPADVNTLSQELDAISFGLDADRVTAIPLPCAYPWGERTRFTFYPSGVDASPAGIAEYVLLRATPQEPAPRCYNPKARTAHFLLYERDPGCEMTAFQQRQRQSFIEHFGAAVLGPA